MKARSSRCLAPVVKLTPACRCAQDTKIIQAGRLFPSDDQRTYSTDSFVEPTWRGPGAGVWHGKPGWETGNQDKIASITISPPCGVMPGYPCPPEPRANLWVEVYCPPYRAPAHGSVWYAGKEFKDSTSPPQPARKMWRVAGKKLPIAQEGDIK